MAIFNSSGMNVGWCVGHVPPHSLSATLIVKGTFQLQRDKAAALLPQQDFLSGDLHEDGDVAKSLRYPSDFEGARLNGAQFLRTQLPYADLVHADLTGADFSEANLEFGNVHAAIDPGTKWFETKLKGVKRTDLKLLKAENWRKEGG